MTYKFTIPGKLPGLNEYTKSNRSNKYGGNKLKKQIENDLIFLAKNQLKKKIHPPVFMRYTWIEPNRKRDKDNIAFAKKFIQDALVKAGKLPNDGWEYIKGFSDDFATDSKKPRIIVEIIEIQEEKPNGKHGV